MLFPWAGQKILSKMGRKLSSWNKIPKIPLTLDFTSMGWLFFVFFFPMIFSLCLLTCLAFFSLSFFFLSLFTNLLSIFFSLIFFFSLFTNVLGFFFFFCLFVFVLLTCLAYFLFFLSSLSLILSGHVSYLHRLLLLFLFFFFFFFLCLYDYFLINFGWFVFVPFFFLRKQFWVNFLCYFFFFFFFFLH